MSTTNFHPAILIPAKDSPIFAITHVLAIRVGPQHGSRIMQSIRGDESFRDLVHVKRIRKDADQLIFLVSPVDESGIDPSTWQAHKVSNETESLTVPFTSYLATQRQLDSIQPAMRHVMEQVMLLEPMVIPVPKFAPMTRQQWLLWNAVWPIVWRPPEPHLGPNPWEITPLQQHTFERYMRRALDLARQPSSSCTCQASSLNTTENHGLVRNACLIVDPTRHVVIASGVDETHLHPLRHAVMAAIDAVAKRDRHYWPLSASADAEQHRMEKKHKPDSSPPPGSPSADPGPRPYLCTGWDCYMVREPCAMCAMALTHSRVNRVIFALENDASRLLHGDRRLHACKSLNHHFKVYHLPLIKEEADNNNNKNNAAADGL